MQTPSDQSPIAEPKEMSQSGLKVAGAAALDDSTREATYFRILEAGICEISEEAIE